MSKIIIVEGNSNDKDNIRAFMVKGPKGDGATIDVVKENGVATITINDSEGEKTFTLSDGEMTKAMVIDSLTSTLTDQPLSANQGKVLKEEIDDKAESSDVYTKAEVDELLESYASKSNNEVSYSEVVTLTSTVELNGIQIPYPEGFNKSNCILTSWKEHLTNISTGTGLIRQNFGFYDSLGGAFFTIHYENDYVLLFPVYDTSFYDAYTIQIEALFTKLEVDVSEYTLGDVNMDGELTQDDLTLIYNYASPSIKGGLTAKQFKLADMNYDGKVTTMDYVILNNIINNNNNS